MEKEILAFTPIFILMIFAVVIYFSAIFVSQLISTKSKGYARELPYECGEIPTTSAWSQFSVRFYLISLIFIIFDVEAILIFPVATLFKSYVLRGEGLYVFSVFFIFLFILLIGMIYCWRKGDLDWIQNYVSKKQ